MKGDLWPYAAWRRDGLYQPSMNSKMAIRASGLCAELSPVEQLALERGKEALVHRDGAHRWTNACLLAAQAEGQRRVLGPLIAMVDNAARSPLPDRHIHRVDDELRLDLMPIAQPTIRREKASSTTDRQIKPAQVGRYLSGHTQCPPARAGSEIAIDPLVCWAKPDMRQQS